MDNNNNPNLKIIIIGNSAAGKTSLLMRFAEQYFSESFSATIGVDYKMRTCTLNNGKSVNLQIWDTAGQEKFRTIVTSYWRGADAALFVFDLTDLDSFHAIKTWALDAERYGKPSLQKLVVGNKADLTKNRVVTRQMGEELSKSLGFPYLEVSAKTGHGVEEAFQTLAENIMANRGNLQEITLNLKEQGPGPSGCCGMS